MPDVKFDDGFDVTVGGFWFEISPNPIKVTMQHHAQ